MGENISENDLIIYPRLSKDYILSQISQETIFQRYLGIRVQYDELVRNPLREDNNPTCGFKWSGSKLRFKDFAGYFWGDCFDLVAYLYGLNSNNSRDFTKVLEIIARDFKIHKYGDPNSIISEDDFIKNLTIGEKKKQETINIRVIPRDFVYEDVKFWEQYKVLSHEIVQRDYNGFPTQEIFLDDKKVYQYGRYKTDICTSYYFGNLPNGMHIWKSYFPKRRKQRFLMNVPVIEGLQAPLIKTDITVITKSYKDVMCINEIVKKYKFSVKVVAIPTENHVIEKETVRILKENSNLIVSLLDFDFTGINMAYKLSTLYNIRPMFLTNGKWNSFDYKAKDYSDYLRDNSLDSSLKLFDNAYTYILKHKEKYATRLMEEN